MISVVDSEAMSQMLPSMLTALPSEANPLPVIVTRVPPPVPPLCGLVDVMVGVRLASYVKEDAKDTLPDVWTTATSHDKVASLLGFAGVNTVSEVVVEDSTTALTPQTVTLLLSSVLKPAPVRVMEVPPPKDPVAGARLVSRSCTSWTTSSLLFPRSGLLTTTG